MRNTHFITLLIILAASSIMRAGLALYIGNDVSELPGTSDQITYHTLATRVLNGYGFTFGENWWPLTRADQPTAHWSYLYTFYLTWVYHIVGIKPIAARLIQAVITGILHPLLAYIITKRIFGSTCGLIAAGITAFYLYFIYYAGTLMTEPFYITSILLVILSTSVLAVSPNTQNQPTYIQYGLPLLAGITLAITVLLRQIFLVYVPVLLFWLGYVRYKKGWRFWKSVFPSVIIVLILIASIFPFTLFNYQRFKRFVLLNTNAGYAFYWANHPIYKTNFIPILNESTGSYLSLVPQDLTTLDEAALDQELLKHGIQFVAEDPLRYLLLSLSRIPIFFMFLPSADSGLLSNVTRVASFGLFFPFMILGIYLTLFYRKRSFQTFLESTEFLLVSFSVLYSLIHIFSWTLIRYRLPVDAVLISYAAYAIYFLTSHKLLIKGTLRQKA